MNTMQELVSRLSPAVWPLFEAARALVHRIDPGVIEAAWPHQKTAGFGVGPKKMSEQYVYIAAYDAHMNFGFYYGAELPDPNRLLQGTGKLMRSMPVRELADRQRDGLEDLVRAATGHLPRLKR